VADINGDGRPDLIYFSTVYGANGSVTVSSRLNTSTGGSVSFSSTLNVAYGFSGSIGSATLLTPLKYLGTQKAWDFNGDGREDLALVWKDTSNPPSTWYYLELLSQGVGFSDSQIGPSTTAVAPSPIHFLKWNDDACTDVRIGSSIYISDCNGSSGSTLSLPFGMVGTLDWNGDGHSDLVVSNGTTLGVYLSTATGLSNLIATSIPYTSTCFYYTFDANGDGLDDLMCWDQLGTTVVKYYLHNGVGQPPDLLTSVTDGYGVAANPTYVSLPRGNYTKRADGNYADVDSIAPLYVVNQFGASDGAGGTYTNSFWYYGAQFNQQGRGFDGFYERRMQDSRKR
jgi:hypothetical protein